jgi:hypothetical protein
MAGPVQPQLASFVSVAPGLKKKGKKVYSTHLELRVKHIHRKIS